MLSSYLTITIFLPLLLLHLILSWRNKNQNKNLPPNPPKLPIIGNLHQIGSLPHRSLWELSKIYGPVILMKLGSVPCVVVSSAEAAKEVLKVHDKESCSKPCLVGSKRLSYNYLDIAFSPYTQHWRETRKLCVLQVFSLKRVQSFRYIREEEVEFVINSIRNSVDSGNPMNLTSTIFNLSAGVMFRIAYGKRFQGSDFEHEDFHELLYEIGSIVGSFSVADFFPNFGWIVDVLTGHHGKIERVFRRLDNLFQEAIDSHMDPERTKEGDIIDVLLDLQKEHSVSSETTNTKWVTADHIKAILMNMFFGGIDTSALTVVWAMTELARNPRVMKEAQTEIRSCLGTNKDKVTEDDIDHLKYLKLVIKETMRLHNFVPLLVVREAMSHFKINNYDVFPKTLVMVNAWAIARDPLYWKDPEEFVPERFIEKPVEFMGQNFEYLPFGYGRRSCPGMSMGLSTAELLLANLLYCFDWQLPEGMKEEDICTQEKVGVTVGTKMPLRLVPVKYPQ